MKKLLLPMLAILLLQMTNAQTNTCRDLVSKEHLAFAESEIPDDVTISPEEILYWIGTGAHQAIFVVNWCNPEHAFAWGYRFSTDTVLVSKIMDDIAAVDNRFYYTSNNGWLYDILFTDRTMSLSLSGDYWLYNVNGMAAQVGYNEQKIVHGDIVKWGDELCAHLDEEWNTSWTTPIVPLSAEIFDGSVGTAGCQAIHRDNAAIIGWAIGCTVSRGYQDIAIREELTSYGTPENAIGKATDSYAEVVSLGDSGVAVLTFATPITNGDGYDFAVFENSFDDQYLELAFVEVSSDGIYWARFPALSNTQTHTQIDGFGTIDATRIHNLAGKHRAGWGTPFDLEDLAGDTLLDVNNIQYVKIIDVIGAVNPPYASYDFRNKIINDPYPTNSPAGGFDLAGVAVMNGWKPSAVATAQLLQYSVYPNPCVEYVWVSTPQTGTSLRLYNILGTLLWQGNVSGESTKIEMQHYPSGLYILTVGDFKAKIVKR